MEAQVPGPSGSPRGSSRPPWLVPVLIPLIALIVAGAALGALLIVRSGDHGKGASADRTTIIGPPTSVVAASTTTEAAVSTTEAMTTTIASASTTTGPDTRTTLGGAGDKWQKSPASLADLASGLAQALPAGQTVYLPDHLPQGWAISAPDQVYGDIAAGYFADVHTNPSLLSDLSGDPASFMEYVACFTNGTDVAGVMVIIGDWGDTQFDEVTAYGKQLYVFQDDSMVAVLVPGWEPGTLVATPGAREAALEIAAAIKAW